MSRLTPEQRRERARLAALTRWANTTDRDRSAATRPARDALAAKWAAAPNPAAARAAHFSHMRNEALKARKSA